jgi:hypothetical protein
MQRRSTAKSGESESPKPERVRVEFVSIRGSDFGFSTAVAALQLLVEELLDELS